MAFSRALFRRTFIGTIVLSGVVAMQPAPAPGQPAQTGAVPLTPVRLNDLSSRVQSAPEVVSGYRPTEVRLRKLHLVRPDLIPYPIAYEVVC